MEDKSLNKLNGVFEVDETYESNNWLRVNIRTYAFGKNRNGSDILNSSLSDFSKAKSTIGAVPIVARYNDATDDLEGHNVILRKNKDDEYEIYHDTDALGFTSPTTSFHIEEANEGTEENPDYKTYVVIEDVYLWKRFDATKKIIQWISEGISPKVSMEIDQVEGQFDKEGYFQIHDFEFTGIAALGSDVEPCFPRAEIQLYTVNEFREELKELMSELNYHATQEGGTGMEDKTKVEEVKSTQETELETEFTETKVDDVATQETEKVEENFELEKTDAEADVETEVKDTQEFEKQDEEKEEETLPAQEFALTANQLRDQLRAELGKEHYHDTWGDKCRKYYLIDNTDALVIFENTQENYQLYAAPFALNGDNVELQLDQAYKVKVEYVAFEGDVSLFSERFEVEKATLQSELTDLKSYKRTREEEDLQAKFADKLSTEEFTQVFTEMKESELDKVEEKLFALIGKKNFTVSKPVTQVNKVVLPLPKEEDTKQSPYGNLFEKHNTKL